MVAAPIDFPLATYRIRVAEGIYRGFNTKFFLV